MALTWMPIGPTWLIAAAGAMLLLLLAHGCLVLARKQVATRWIAGLGALRVIIIAVALLCALRPTVAIPREKDVAEDIALLIDTSASMASKEVAELDALRAHLADQFNLHVYAVGDGARRVLSGHALPAPTDTNTDLASSIATFTQLGRLYQRNKTASQSMHAVLISDGIDHGDTDAVSIAQQYGVTIDAVLPNAAREANDAPPRLTSVQSPDRVRLGATVRFAAQLIAPASKRDREYVIELLDGDAVVQRMNATFAPRQTVAPLVMHHRPTEIGMRRYTLRLADQPDAADLAVAVQVIGDRMAVLMLEGTWRWGFRYARRVIEADPTLSLTAFMARNDRSWMQYTEPWQAEPLTGMPVNVADLAGFDVFVLGDVDPRTLPQQTLDAIARLVVDGGRSLVFVAGPDTVRLGATPSLAGLLPVVFDESTRHAANGPVPLRVSDDAINAPTFFRPGGEMDAFWRALPPVERIYPVRRKKPGATVLLEAASLGNANGPLIVAATHQVGRGRVLYVGTDALWQWQMLGPMSGTNLTPYAVFWQQVLRAMSPPHPPAHEDGAQWRIMPRRSVVRVGQTIAIDAVLDGASADTDVKVQGTATFADGSTSPLLLTPDALAPGRYSAAVYAAAGGPCTIQLSARTSQRVLAEAKLVINVEPAATEQEDVGVDTLFLSQLAARTGGVIVDPTDKATWPMPSSAARLTVQEVLTLDLWQNFALPWLLIFLLGFDWTLRLVRGYA